MVFKFRDADFPLFSVFSVIFRYFPFFPLFSVIFRYFRYFPLFSVFSVIFRFFRYFPLFPLLLARSALRRSVFRFFPTCMLIFSIFSYFIFLFLNFLSLFVFIFCETARTRRFSVLFAKVQWHPWFEVFTTAVRKLRATENVNIAYGPTSVRPPRWPSG